MIRRLFLVLVLATVAADASGAGAAVRLPEFAVGASRLPRPAGEGLGVGRFVAARDLAAAPVLDGALRADPAFGLFRRSDSLSANPTAQGVSLRGIGPSGASRTLVLLDGVPLNDPFGGWVPWNALPTLALAAAEIRPGGGSAAWGNAALGGVVALTSREPTTEPGGVVRATAGERGQLGAEAWLEGTAAGATADVALRFVDTEGHVPLQPADRGAVDRPLSVRARAAQVRVHGSLGDTAVRLTVRRFDEDRGNGTVAQGNSSEIAAASLSLGGRAAELDWRGVAYVQSQTFASRFTTVAPGRAAETPANDQFDVPATAWGGSVTLARDLGRHRLAGGVDVRAVRGETREDFLFSAGAFARRRHAGGAQRSAGGFLGAETAPSPSVRVLAQARLDRWTQEDGRRREVTRADGGVLRDESFPRRAGFVGDGTLEVRWAPGAGAIRYRAAAYSAHRLPTLNELYRPFRVGIASTEANPELRIERLRGGEVGLEADWGAWRVAVTAFRNQVADAVGNVTLASGPSAITRQRLNLDRVRIDGGEISAEGRWGRDLRLGAAALVSHGTVERASAQPGLEGLRLAQAPRLTLTAAAAWRVGDRTEVTVRGRWGSQQFEDDENRLPLASAGTVDLAVERRLDRRTALRLDLDNLLDADVPVGRTAGGPTSYAAPRAVRGSIRVGW